MADDQQKMRQTSSAQDDADEEVADGKSIFGHAPEDVEDIDNSLQAVGLPSDEDGPRELNSQAVIDKADKNQE